MNKNVFCTVDHITIYLFFCGLVRSRRKGGEIIDRKRKEKIFTSY